MRIIFTSPKGKKYMVKPSSSGLDYESYVENSNYGKPKKKGKNKGEVVTEEWTFLHKYSNSLWYGIKECIDSMMRDPEEAVVIKTNWGPLMKQVSGIEDCIRAYIDKIEMEIQNGN